MSGHLTLQNGSAVPIKNGFVLGRVAGCDLVVDDAKASRRHAKLIVEAGVVEIEDLESSNGTLLNDKPVTRRLLRDGDRIQIGKTVFVYHERDLPSAASGGAAVAPPAATPKAASTDDNDLFGDAATSIGMAPPPPPPPQAPRPAAPPAAPPAPPPRPIPAPPAAGQPAPMPAAAPKPPPSPLPPASPLPRPSVVEFADEVVEVRKAAPKSEPPAGKASAAAGPAVATAGSRVLQFQKRAGGPGGLLGDDLGQLSGGMRGLLIVGVLVLGAGIVFVVMRLMS